MAFRSELGRVETAVHGRLIKVHSPLAVPNGAGGGGLQRSARGAENPYYLGDEPALTQTSGWADAWTSAKSVYAVAAEETSDVVAAVNFARDHRLRLVVKGGAHSYQAPQTRRIRCSSGPGR